MKASKRTSARIKEELKEKRRLEKERRQAIRDLKRQEAEEARKKIQKGLRPKLSDHAIVRYLERAYKLDLSVLEKEILPDETVEAIRVLGGVDGDYPVGDSHRVVVRNSVVVTVIA